MAVYMIQVGTEGPVKIGVSRNPFQRLVKIQSDNPGVVRIIRILAGDVAEETAVQKRFDHLHLEREWFQFSLELFEDVGIEDLPTTKTKNRRGRKPISPEGLANMRAAALRRTSDPATRAASLAKLRETQRRKDRAELARLISDHGDSPKDGWPKYRIPVLRERLARVQTIPTQATEAA